MDIAVAIFPTDRAMPPDELAKEVEARGFWSLLFPEHTHIPMEHSPFPGGGELPERYFRTLDPFIACTAAATVTSELRIGTGISLVAQHDPIALAKSVASVDHLSGGRFIFGIGYGWNVPEVEHHGIAFAKRRDYVRDAVLAMRRLWTEEVASFQSEHVTFGPSYAWPKPVQKPHPPIWLGASFGPKALTAMVEFCTGWMPNRPSGLEDALPQLRQALVHAGRDPDLFEVLVHGAHPDPEQLRHLAQLGVTKASFWLPSAERAELIPTLDEFARCAELV